MDIKKLDYRKIAYIVAMIFIAFKFFDPYYREDAIGTFLALNLVVIASTLLSINNKMRNKGH